MEKKLKDYLHLYLGCEVMHETLGVRKLEWVSCITDSCGLGSAGGSIPIKESKPILRPLSDMTEEDFNEFAKSVLHREGEVMVYAEVNRQWCAASIDIENCYELEDIERTSAKEMICNAEEADYDNVLSCDKGKSIAYGANDEMRYFVGVEVQAQFVRFLLSKHFDLFGLVDAGLAIDSTTLKPTHQ